MSLINDMLKDLDSRERSHSRPLKRGVYDYANDSRPKRQPWVNSTALLQAVLTLLVAGAIAWWVTHQQELTATRATQASKEAIESEHVTRIPDATKLNPIELPQAAPAIPEPVVTKPKSVEPHLEMAKKTKAPVPTAKTAEAPRLASPVVKTSVVEATSNAKPSITPTQVKVDAAQKSEQFYQQALTEQKQGAVDAAMKSLRLTLDIYPQHSKARLELARLLVERKQATAAADLLGDGLMLLPQQTGFMLAIAPLWIQAGQQNDAMALLAQGTKSANNDPVYHGYYAAQLLRLKRPAEAVTHYRIALRSESNKSEWLLGLGLSLHAAGNIREAIDALRRASESGGLSPQNKTMVEQVIVKLQSPTS
jgi:Tfp pilus assembly protein PilF